MCLLPIPFSLDSWGENEVLTSDMLVGTLFSLGTRVRRCTACHICHCALLPQTAHVAALRLRCLHRAPVTPCTCFLYSWRKQTSSETHLLCPPYTQARRVYFTLPEALHRSQPGARQACYRHFHRSQVWDLAQPVEQLRWAAGMDCCGVAAGAAASSCV